MIAGDGQVTMGQTIVKSNAKKLRRLGSGKVIAGFAGATADAFALFERLEAQARAVSGAAHPRLRRAGQGLAHRPLSAPARGDDGGGRQERVADPVRHRRRAGARGRLIGIGSGGGYALAAARALIDIDGLDAEAIARKAMAIAAGICVYTNDKITIETAYDACRLQPARDRLRARPPHRRPGRRQARRRHRAAQPLAPPAAARGAARGGAAQEHPDDRPDRRRQDRDRAPPGASWRRRRSSRSRRPNSPRSAMSAATSSRSCATWSRSRSP